MGLLRSTWPGAAVQPMPGLNRGTEEDHRQGRMSTGERGARAPLFVPSKRELPQHSHTGRKTMWNFLVFALIGLLVGTAARMFYPGR